MMLPSLERMLERFESSVKDQNWFNTCDASREIFLELRRAYRRWPAAVELEILLRMDRLFRRALEVMPETGDERLMHYRNNVGERYDALKPIVFVKSLAAAAESCDEALVCSVISKTCAEIARIFGERPKVLDSDYMRELGGMIEVALKALPESARRDDAARQYQLLRPILVIRQLDTAVGSGNPWKILKASMETRPEPAETFSSIHAEISKIDDLFQKAVDVLPESTSREELRLHYQRIKPTLDLPAQ